MKYHLFIVASALSLLPASAARAQPVDSMRVLVHGHHIRLLVSGTGGSTVVLEGGDGFTLVAPKFRHPISGSNSMSHDSTLVTIRYQVQPDQGEALRVALRALIATVVATESDCFGIQLLHDPDDDARVLLLERWRTRAAYEGPHMQTPHLIAFMGHARALLAGPPVIEFWPQVEPFDP